MIRWTYVTPGPAAAQAQKRNVSTKYLYYNLPTSEIAVELFAVEIRTAQWQPMVLWYASALEMKVAVRSEDDGYALLVGEGWRVSLLQLEEDEPRDRAAISLAIEVEDLEMTVERLGLYLTSPAEPVAHSEEGFLQWTVADPDGNRIKLFQFVTR